MDLPMTDDQQPQESPSEALEAQVAKLREQVSSLTAQLAEGAMAVKEKAGGLYDAAAEQAKDIGEVTRAYPVAITSASAGGIVLGIVIGLILGRSHSRSWYERDWR